MKKSIDQQLGLPEGTVLKALQKSTEDMNKKLVNTWHKKLIFWWIALKNRNATK